MVRRALPRVHALIALAISLGTCTGLAACAPTDLGQSSQRAGVPAAGLLRLDEDFAVGARATGGQVELLSFTREENGAWRTDVIGKYWPAAPNSVSMVAFEGDTGLAWNGYIYGSADPRASDVHVALPGATGGKVAAGGWVVAVPSGVIPADFAWQMLDPHGGITASGRGVWPPSS
jgi:hypothetical protein